MGIQLEEVLNCAIFNDCSDIHIRYGEMPHFKKGNEVFKVETFSIVSEYDISLLLNVLLNSINDGKEKIKQYGYVKGFYEDCKGRRYNICAYLTRGKISIHIHIVKNSVSTLLELNLKLEDFIENKKGILVYTEKDKMKRKESLASMIDYLNSTNNYHIVVLEDGIEYTHKNRLSLVSQIDIKLDILSNEEDFINELNFNTYVDILVIDFVVSDNVLNILKTICEDTLIIIGTNINEKVRLTNEFSELDDYLIKYYEK